jgi:Tfp pilus assembly protein PilX
MKNLRVRTNGESGQVSIITVIAFILLFSVLVISFSRIMVTASRQAVNDELAASAKAAAESGIEDAKRILSYCAADMSTPGCEVLSMPIDDTNYNCTKISSNSSLMTNIQRTVSSGSSVKVGDSAGNEEYLCLKMSLLVPDYLGSLSSTGNSDGQSESIVVPLKLVNSDGDSTAPAIIQVQWHNTSPDSDGAATLLAGSDLPAASKWNGTVPAVMRVEFVAVPKAGFTIDNLVANTRAVTLRPSTSTNRFGADAAVAATTTGTTAYNLNSWIASTQPNNSPTLLLQIKCNAGSTTGYVCSVPFTIPKDLSVGGTDYLFDTATYDYYLRMQATYQSTHFRLSAKDVDGKELYFNGIQASIDVTGRASESLKRLSVRLDPNNGDQDNQWWPDYVVDTAGKVCKDMTIEAWEGTDNCTD